MSPPPPAEVRSRAAPPRPPSLAEAVQELLRAIGSTEGFALLPVEVPGPDLGRGLARRLGEHGHPVRVVAPEREEDWAAVVSALARAAPPPHGAAMLLGPGQLGPGLERGLRVLNQRRQQLIDAIDAPLLWVGPPAFLQATWELAPDFWSVRGLTTRVGPRSARLPSRPAPWSGPLVEGDPDELGGLAEEALRQHDRRNAARMAYLQAAALAARGEPEAARAALAPHLDLPLPDDELAFDLTILDARLAHGLGRRGDLRHRVASARRLAGRSPGRRAQLDLLTARRLVEGGQKREAIELLRRAVATCGDERPFLCARALTALARLERTMGQRQPARLVEAEEHLRRALRLFQSQGEALGEATVLLELGDLARQLGRSAEAMSLYRGALGTFERHGASAAVPEVRRRLRAAAREEGSR